MKLLRPSSQRHLAFLLLAAATTITAGCELIAAVDRDKIVEGALTGQGRGVLGGYQDGQVWGWAQIVGQDEPVQVRIEVDGVEVEVFTADQPRSDLQTKGLHPTGNAGFSGSIGQQPAGAVVSAFIVSTGQQLTGSPIVVEGGGTGGAGGTPSAGGGGMGGTPSAGGGGMGGTPSAGGGGMGGTPGAGGGGMGGAPGGGGMGGA